MFPDLGIFRLRRDLVDLGFPQKVVAPVLRMVQTFRAEDLLSVHLVLWHRGAGIASAFFDMRRAEHRRDYETVRGDVISERTLLALFDDACRAIEENMTREERAELRAAMLAAADKIDARGETMKRSARRRRN